jgi:FKBP-type peptidyl-prolyl cis-trans isomerase
MKTRFLMLVGALALGGCLSTTEPVSSDPLHETFAPALGVDMTTMTQTTNGDFFKDLTVGTGSQLNVLVTDSVRIDFEAYLKDGYMFASDTNVVTPLEGNIFGLIDGMHGMNIGGRRLIVIPSKYGFGANYSDIIPPNATLIYFVTLRNIYAKPATP